MTDFDALDALYPLPPDELPKQWVLAQDAGALPKGWPTHSHGGWHLGAHPRAYACDLHARDGTPIGWVIEPLAYLGDRDADEGHLALGPIVLPVSPKASAAIVEQALYGRDACGRSQGGGLTGRWTAVVMGGPSHEPWRRVYVSPTHSVVYHREQRVVASTHNLVPGLGRDEALSRAVDPLATKAFYPFGLTPFNNLHRLQPGHFLNLSTFEPVRHWPRQPFELFASGEEGAAAVVEQSRRLVGVLAGAYDEFLVFLSAGRDSRAVLALLRPFVGGGTQVRLQTTVADDYPSRIDGQAGRRLASIAGLPHRVVQRRPYDTGSADVLRAFVRIGEARAGRLLSSPGWPRRPSSPPGFKLGGMAGEAGRGYYWAPEPPAAPLMPEGLLRRIVPQAQPSEALHGAAQGWLDGLPEGYADSPADVLDLAYVEQRLGCWRAPSAYLYPGTDQVGPLPVSNPLAEAAPLEAMLRLPRAYRASGRLQRDMVAYGWPELLTVPFNEPTGWLRFRRGVTLQSNRIRRHLGRLRSSLLSH